MKTHITFPVFLFALIVFGTVTLAQITITSADASAINAVGNVITNHSDTLVTSIDIGSPGATSWDFSALNSHTSNSFTSVTPSSTPYYSSDFPTSNVVFTFTEIIDGNLADGWSYSTQNPGDQLMNGIVIKSSIETDTFIVKIVYSPAQLDLPLPFTYNSQWGGDFVITNSTFFNGVPFFTTTANHTESVIVDAWGNMTMPGGAVVPALRVLRDDRYTSSGFYVRTISYSFITKSGATVGVVANDTTAPNSGIIQTEGVTWSSPIAVSVENEDQIPSQYSLEQNYPNPFNPSTTIRYALPFESKVAITVYNLLGQEVATLVNDVKSSGYHEILFNASELSSGVYLYRINAVSSVGSKEFSSTKKLILLK